MWYFNKQPEGRCVLCDPCRILDLIGEGCPVRYLAYQSQIWHCWLRSALKWLQQHLQAVGSLLGGKGFADQLPTFCSGCLAVLLSLSLSLSHTHERARAHTHIHIYREAVFVVVYTHTADEVQQAMEKSTITPVCINHLPHTINAFWQDFIGRHK